MIYHIPLFISFFFAINYFVCLKYLNVFVCPALFVSQRGYNLDYQICLVQTPFLNIIHRL